MYASVDVMTARFGQREVIALSDRDDTGAVDVDVINGALVDASSEMDSYLAGRYALPLNPVPQVLIGLCCDIARYRLCGSETSLTEVIESRYKSAIKFLTLVAKGDVTVGVTTEGTVVPSDNTIVFSHSQRAFGRENW